MQAVSKRMQMSGLAWQVHRCKTAEPQQKEPLHTLRPSEEQSEMGHPWSVVENGQAPLLG